MRSPRSTKELRAGIADRPATAGAAGVPCLGDGQDGYRVQAVYAVAADRPDRYDDIAPLIAGWAADIDAAVADSAVAAGGERRVRFVTDGNCRLDVLHVVLSSSGDDTFSNTVNELKALGHDRADRKYLIWMDANVYCGLAMISTDDSPGQDNANNGARPLYGRVDSGCWGQTASVELHELVHTLGGVQKSAPHATPGHHCTDNADRMCYNDGSGLPMTQDCPSAHERLLDCNFDDYFNPSPAPGSYLDTHWNVADSVFLAHGGGAEPPPPPANEPPSVDAGPDLDVESGAAATLAGSVTDDGLPAGQLDTSWSVVTGPGTVTFGDPAAPSTTVTFADAGEYVLELAAHDGELSSADRATVVVVDQNDEPVEVVEIFDSSIRKRHRVREFTVTSGAGRMTIALKFSQGGKRRGPAPRMEFSLLDANGTVLAQAEGTTPVVAKTVVAAGAYRIRVSGSLGKFRLVVRHMSA